MSLFDKIFGKMAAVKQAKGYFKTLTAYQPVFTNWNGALYESELVRSSIDAIARSCSKLKVEINGSAQRALRTQLKKAPNEWQTWSQYLYRLSTILYADNTAFIVPVYNDYGELTGTYPVLPSMCEIVEAKNGTPYLRYHFSSGQVAAVELKSCGIMTRFQYDRDFFGASQGSLSPTMDLISIQNQGIKEGVKNGATFRFMAQLNNFADDEDVAKLQKEFSARNFKQDKSGVLLWPNTFNNIQQINSAPFVVNAAQMEQIRKNVFDYFGVNEDILQNKAFGDAWSAFYEGCIEWFSIQFSEVMTKMLFTDREQANGSEVMATANRLQYMTNQDKLNVSSQMLDRGIMSRNEVREIWNLPPIEGGDDYIIRGEYYNADEKLEETPAENPTKEGEGNE